MGHCWVSSIVSSKGGANGFELTGLQSHKEIVEMQCDLLTSNFKDPKMTSLMKENIERIKTSEGSLSHCAGSLKLGFRRAFELKKQRRGVKLRCNFSRCQMYNVHVSYSSAHSNGWCSFCNYWLYCAGCGSQRGGNPTSCGSCGKRFI